MPDSSFAVDESYDVAIYVFLKEMIVSPDEKLSVLTGDDQKIGTVSLDLSKLYSAVSRAFDPPKTGKIAIKMINYDGDEVLKVFEIF